MKSKKPNRVYRAALAIYRVLFYGVFGGRIYGRVTHQVGNNLILLGNHTNLFDPFTLAICAPGFPISFMGKDSLFKIGWFSRLIKHAYAFPVQRGASDLAAMRLSMQVVRDGGNLGIFPEGTRNKNPKEGLLPLQSGASLLALKTVVPLVPIFISGKYRPFGHLRVVVGRPILVDDLRAEGANSQNSQILLARITAALTALSVRASDL